MSEPTSQAWWVPDHSAAGEPAGPAAATSAPAGPEVAVTTRLTEPSGPPDLLLLQAPSAASDRSARRRAVAIGAGAGGVVLLLGLAGWGLTTVLRPARTPATGNVAASRVRSVDPATVTASASSTQHPDGPISYAVANTLDGDPATAWNSDGARDGQGPGIALTYRFAEPVDLAAISVLNGYQKVRPRPGRPALDLYPLNERVRRLRVVTDSGAWNWDLADSRARQVFTPAHGSTRTVRLEVTSIYPSSAYPDLALSEVSFTAATPG
jgi:hypothetical protein